MVEIAKKNSGLSLTSYAQYNAFIRQFNEYAKGTKINDQLIEGYFKYLQKNNYSPSSQRLAKVAIKKAVLQSVQLDVYDKEKVNVFFKTIKVDKPVVCIGEHKVISQEEIRQLIDHSSKKIGLMIRFLYNTGCRVSEMLNIKISSCELSGSSIVVTITGKGRKQRRVAVDSDLYRDIQKIFGSKKYLFQNHYNNSESYTRQYVTREVKRVSMEIIRKNISAHCLRHSRATHLLKEKESIEAVSKFLGHSKVSITYEIYAHNQIGMDKLIKTGI